MFLLILGVQFRVVRFAISQHFEDDLEQTLSQAAERAGVAHALFSFLFVIGLRPGTGFAKAVGPKMDSLAQEFVAGPAHFGFADLAGLEADRRCSRKALQDIGTALAVGIAAHRCQKSRSQHFFSTG